MAENTNIAASNLRLSPEAVLDMTVAEATRRYDLDWVTLALAIALGLAVFCTITVCMAFPSGTNVFLSFWFTNGIPLAFLLRTRTQRWPFLILAAVIGNASAVLAQNWAPEAAAVRALTSVAQFGTCAYFLRRKLGPYFDLTNIGHISWLGALGFASTVLRIALLIPLASFVGPPVDLRFSSLIPWILAASLGLFVFSLPLLAITARPSSQKIRPDWLGAALLVGLIAVLVLVFGPLAFPTSSLIMPILMALAWRYGQQGAGIGALVTIVFALTFTYFGQGLAVQLGQLGYGPMTRSFFLEMLFAIILLISLPIAVARERQLELTRKLEATLEASQSRARELAASEAAARISRESLMESERRFRAIFEGTPFGIGLVDTERNVFVDVNPRFAEIAGWSVEALLEKCWQDITHPDDMGRNEELLGQYLAGGIPSFQMQKRYIREDGGVVWVNLTITSFSMQLRGRKHNLCIIEDITEQRSLEAQVYAAQRMEAVGQLTGGVAHDFNNLLTVVIGNAEVLAAHPNHPKQQQLAAMIKRAGEQGSELTRQLLAFARRQPLAPRAFEANALLDAAMPLIARTLGADLEFRIRKSSGLWQAFADPPQLETAILNLCLNARDAMPGGGRLSIETANANLTDEFVSKNPGARTGNYVMVSVSDSGTGIAPDIIGRIFEPFFTTKDVGKGSGLGLSMVYGFMRQSNGYVRVTSEMGKGTVVELYLPAAAEADRISDEASSGARAMRRGEEKVLVVEDNDLVREHLLGQLESLGYQVTVVGNAPAAIAVMEESDDIDLLFTDVVMPGGMSGLQLGKQVSERWPHIRILYTSGYAQDSLTAEGRQMEGITMLQKPYSRDELSQKLRQVLDAA